jgi:hypothetical protein
VFTARYGLYLCVLCGSQNKQRLFHCTTLTDCLCNWDGVCLLRGTSCILICNSGRTIISISEPLSTTQCKCSTVKDGRPFARRWPPHNCVVFMTRATVHLVRSTVSTCVDRSSTLRINIVATVFSVKTLFKHCFCHYNVLSHDDGIFKKVKSSCPCTFHESV